MHTKNEKSSKKIKEKNEISRQQRVRGQAVWKGEGKGETEKEKERGRR